MISCGNNSVNMAAIEAAWCAVKPDTDCHGTLCVCDACSSRSIPYLPVDDGFPAAGGTERLDLGTAVSHVRRLTRSATRVWSAFLLTARRGPGLGHGRYAF